jgi:hypothetical protein
MCRTAPSKLSSVERTVNRLLYLILGTQVGPIPSF